MSLVVDKDFPAHATNISTVLCHQDKIITGSDDGIVKIWSKTLEPVGEIQAPGGILSIAAKDNIIYTCTSDETIQGWDLKTCKFIKHVKSTLVLPLRLFCAHNGNLWAGDSIGNVAEYKNFEEIGKYELAEEVWDLIITSDPTCVYTARDRDVVVCEIVTRTGTRKTAAVKKTMPGRSPMCMVGTHLCFLDQTGMKVCVYENNLEEKFPKVSEFPVSDFIVNTLARGSDNTMFSAGYDNTIKKWDISTKQCVGSVKVNSIVNSLFSPSPDEVIAALSSGNLIRAVKK